MNASGNVLSPLSCDDVVKKLNTLSLDMKLLSTSASRTDMVLSMVGGGWFWFAFRENPYLTSPLNNMATSPGFTALLSALIAVMLVAIGYTVCSFFISKINNFDRVSTWIKYISKLLFLLVIFISSVFVKTVENSGLSVFFQDAENGFGLSTLVPPSGGLYFSESEFHSNPPLLQTKFQTFEIDRTESQYRQIQQSEVAKFRTEIGTSYLFSLNGKGDLVNITKAGFYRNFGHSMLVARTEIFSEKDRSSHSYWNLTVMVNKNESLFRLECDQYTSSGELPDSHACQKKIADFLGEQGNYFDQFDERETLPSDSLTKTEKEEPRPETSNVDEYKFVGVDLPRGISIELPENWVILSDNKTIAIDTVTASGLSAVGIDTDKSEFSLAATLSNDSGFAIGILNVRYYPTLELTQADADAFTGEDVIELDGGLQDMIRKSVEAFGMTVTSWTGTEKTIINGTTVFLTEYRRKALSSDGDFRVRLVRILSGNRSVNFTVSYQESAEFLRPITDQIINSINFDGTENTSEPIRTSNANTKSSKLVEQNLYAILQVSHPDSSKIQVDIKSDVGSRSFGEHLNKATWTALKKTCPACVLDYSGVVTKLSPEFELTFTNQSISYTYLQLDKERIIFLGSTAQEGLETCRAMANIFKQNGRLAKCIPGVQPCPKNDPLGIRQGNENCTLVGLPVK